MSRSCYLSTVELHRLDRACRDLWALDDDCGVYLVGSAGERPDFRDVDVRLILPDERFDALFGHAPALWALFCFAVSRQLGADTGLPVDFQVQRQTEANEKDGRRNPLGAAGRRLTDRGRQFAGMGDATKFGEPKRGEDCGSSGYVWDISLCGAMSSPRPNGCTWPVLRNPAVSQPTEGADQ